MINLTLVVFFSITSVGCNSKACCLITVELSLIVRDDIIGRDSYETRDTISKCGIFFHFSPTHEH